MSGGSRDTCLGAVQNVHCRRVAGLVLSHRVHVPQQKAAHPSGYCAPDWRKCCVALRRIGSIAYSEHMDWPFRETSQIASTSSVHVVKRFGRIAAILIVSFVGFCSSPDKESPHVSSRHMHPPRGIPAATTTKVYKNGSAAYAATYVGLSSCAIVWAIPSYDSLRHFGMSPCTTYWWRS
ncbi:hypothetical protein BKA66DRAFT_440072 [Pyrenochaeta sp. MPI-SDFR-AT-0127]|nr:hypothetical protein BKA66DRAFT_440072 [Pyrenochaeta sp. MPI-SDFR-AT-0127]